MLISVPTSSYVIAFRNVPSNIFLLPLLFFAATTHNNISYSVDPKYE
jgi:hypothetical protein